MTDEALFARLEGPGRHLLAGFGALSPIQRLSIPPILAGTPCLLIAPTASGKTEAAVAPVMSLAHAQRWSGNPGVLYVAPTRALVNDVHRRLSVGLAGHATVGRRTAEHRDGACDVLITTPESLDSMLVRGWGQAGTHRLARVRAVLLDELHLLAESARGSQLNVLLARLQDISDGHLLRVGMSATVANGEALAQRFLGAGAIVATAGCGRLLRVDRSTGSGALPERSEGGVDQLARELWTIRRDGQPDPAMARRLLELRGERKLKALVFVPSRSRCDRLSAELRDAMEVRSPVRVLGHHGSLSKATREATEAILAQEGESVAVATATLELGIDIGTINTVVLDGAPGSVSSLLQRIGRANRREGAVFIIPFAGSPTEACMLASMLRAAIGGELDPAPGARHYSVAIQQAASMLRQARLRRETRGRLVRLMAAEFPKADALMDGLIEADWLELRGDGTTGAGLALAEVMDSDLRLHTNIGSSTGIPVVDELTGEPLAWVPRQRSPGRVLIAGGSFQAVDAEDCIRLKAIPRRGDAQTLQYAVKRAPVLRNSLRHLCRGLGLADNAVVRHEGMWCHFGGALYARLLEAGGVDGTVLYSQSDPRRVVKHGWRAAAERNWQRLEPLFGFGPFQSSLPSDLRRMSVVDSLESEEFEEWVGGLQEQSLNAEQAQVLFGP